MGNTRQSEIIESALEGLKSMFDANTVCGTPIRLENGGAIIPISKIFVGLATGGIDYFGKRSLSDKNFGGGGGTGVTVCPVAFLVIDKNSRVELLSLEGKEKDPFKDIVGLIESSPEIIEKLKFVFGKKSEE